MKANKFINLLVTTTFVIVASACTMKTSEAPPSLIVETSDESRAVIPITGCWQTGFIITESICQDSEIDYEEILRQPHIGLSGAAKMVFGDGPMPSKYHYSIVRISGKNDAQFLLNSEGRGERLTVPLTGLNPGAYVIDIFAQWGNWGDAY